MTDAAAGGISVSAILLCYNCEEFVAAALESVLVQEHSAMEVLVSDDASQDGTFEILQNDIALYPGPHRVELVRRETNSRSKSAHLNWALPRVSGEIVVFFDGDDVSKSDRVSRIIEAFESHEQAQAVYSAMSLIDRHGRSLGFSNVPHPRSPLNTRAWFARVDAYAAGGTLAIRRRVFEVFGDLDPDIHEDVVLPFRASLLGEVVYLTKPLVAARRHAGSLTTRTNRHDSVEVYRSSILAGVRKARAQAASRRADLTEAQRLMPQRRQELDELFGLVSASLAAAELSAKLLDPSRRVRLSALVRLVKLGAYRDEFWRNLFVAISPAGYLRFRRWRMGRRVL